MDYKCYGLRVSSEIALPELQPLPTQNHVEYPQVSIVFGKVEMEGRGSGIRHGPRLWSGERELCLHVPGVARFMMREGREIIVDPEPGADEDSIRVYLLGSAFGVVLFQLGFLVLHGNAVRVGDGCMVCVGESGAGKSTLAAAFMMQGYQILADDVVPVNAQGCAIPGFPRIKLWQDSAALFRIDTAGLQRIRPQMEKFSLLATENFADRPLQVKWIYVLERHQGSELVFKQVRGMERFRFLLRNTYRARYMKALSLHGEHLQMCSQLAGKAHLSRLIRPERGGDVEELVRRILDDIAENA